MINALILATFAFTALYVSVAMVAHFHDCLMARRKKSVVAQTVSKTVEAIATEKAEEVTPAIELPDSIRGLRQFVRENTLQDAIRAVTGRSVSKPNKSELHQAVTTAIA